MENNQLAFDTEQRFAAIAGQLAALGVAAQPPGADGYHLLDVGGFPGTLADRLAAAEPPLKTLTLDTPECDRPDYRQGTGARLPFDDGAFPAVVASDTLEHIPPADRVSFLAELVRVARRWVIVSGPLASPANDRAEEALARLHAAWFGHDHRWLGEHRDFGLPGAGLLAEALGPHGALVVEPNGFLATWLLLMAASFHAETLEFSEAEADNSPSAAASAAYLAALSSSGPDDAEPAYRHLVVLDKTAPPVGEAAGDAALDAFPPRLHPGADPDPASVAAVAVVEGFFRGLAAPTDGESGDSPADAESAAYIRQLEGALRLAEMKCIDLEEGEGTFFRRLFGGLFGGFFGGLSGGGGGAPR